MAQLEEVKKIIRSILVSAPVRVTVSSLNHDFKNIEGYNIPFRELGYNSLLHFLHSIPDVLRVNGSNFQSEVTLIITEKVAHVSDMVMKQKKPSKGRNARAPTKSVIRESPYSSQHYPAINNIDMTAGTHSYYEGNKTPFAGFKNELSPFPRPILSSSKAPVFTRRKPTDTQGLQSKLNTPIKTVYSDSSKENDSSTSYNNDESSNEYAEENGRVPSLTKHMPNDCQKIKTSNPGDRSKFERLKRRTLENKSELNHIVDGTKDLKIAFQDVICAAEDIISIESDNNTRVPLEVQKKLKMLIKQYPKGIRCTDLPVLYKNKYHRSLDYQNYGFDRLISLCINLENIFCCESESDCDFKLYDVDNPPAKKKSIQGDNSTEIPQSNILVKTVDISQIRAVKSKDWEVYTDYIPNEALPLGDVIENNSLNDYVIGETIQIVISEIYNPNKFWIYKNDGQLNAMMNCMQNFYRENKKYHIIPEFLIEIGLYCVVHTLDEFQRALVVDLLQEIGGYVRVYLIDYGTLTNLPREKVWFLMKEFSTLPAQAVETTLAGIQPKEVTWNRKSILRFKDMIVSKHVFAKIVHKTDCKLSIHIAVSSMPMQTINDSLVQEGFAEYITNCELQDSTSSTITVSEETNPRKKWLERIKMRNQMK